MTTLDELIASNGQRVEAKDTITQLFYMSTSLKLRIDLLAQIVLSPYGEEALPKYLTACEQTLAEFLDQLDQEATDGVDEASTD